MLDQSLIDAILWLFDHYLLGACVYACSHVCLHVPHPCLSHVNVCGQRMVLLYLVGFRDQTQKFKFQFICEAKSYQFR